MFRVSIHPLPLAAILFLPSAGIAQQTTPPTLSVTTHLVYVDVLVRDKAGRVVTGLQQRDFKVSEDGKPQTIEFFVAHSPVNPDAQPPSSPAAEQKDVFSNLHPGDASRPITIVLFDLTNTPTDDQLSGRQQMLKFLGNLPPGERLTVFTLSNSLDMTQGVSGSAALYNSVSKMLRPSQAALETSKAEVMQDNQVAANYNRQSASGMGSLPGPSASSNAGSRSDNENYETRARSTISALSHLAGAMSGYPGRKSLYWIAESFPLSVELVGPPINSDPSSGSAAQFNGELTALQGHFSQTSKEEMRETLNRMASARIAVYPVSVFGLASQASSAAVTAGLVFGQNPGDPRGGFFTLDNLRSEMSDLAEATGGEAIFGNNDLAGAMRRTMDESASYYTLAYTPTNQNWNGNFRAIRVDASGSASLDYRRGYFATPDGSAIGAGEDMQLAMQPGVPEETSLRLRSRLLPPDPQHPGPIFESTVDPADVAFTTMPDGHRRAKLFVQLIAYEDAQRQPKTLPQTSGTLNIDLDPQRYQFILSAGIAFRQQLQLKPGSYRVLLGVTDQTTHRAGTVEMPLTVPAS